MMREPFRAFVADLLEDDAIEAARVDQLQLIILRDGVTTRDEADALIGLERRVGAIHSSFADFMVTSIVDFVVWTSRPTGYFGRDDALWLVASLSGGQTPSVTARRIAFAVIREAEQVDEALLAFAMRGARGRRPEARDDRRLAA